MNFIMALRNHLHLLLPIFTLTFLVSSQAEEPKTKPKQEEPPAVVGISDLGLEHDGKEVTVVLKVTKAQLIGGEREGKFPHVMLHHDGMKMPPYLAVYAKGELADALHRFACVSPDDKLVGRSIKATGRIKIYKDFPKGTDPTPVYMLDLRDWEKFQILPEVKGK